MLHQIQAGESLRAANVIGVGAGRLSKEDTRAILKAWASDQRPANRPRTPAPSRSLKSPDALRQMGIGVRRAKKPRVPDGR